MTELPPFCSAVWKHRAFCTLPPDHGGNHQGIVTYDANGTPIWVAWL